MDIDVLLGNMVETLSKLYICKNSSTGIVNSDIDDAILYFEKMLIKNDCILSYSDVEVKLDNNTLYNTLFSISSDIQYYNSLFNDDYLVGAWWNVCLAMNDLKIENKSVKKCVKERAK